MQVVAKASISFPGERRFVVAVVACAAVLAVGLSMAVRWYGWLALYAVGIALLCYAAPLLRRHWVASKWPITDGLVLLAVVERVQAYSEDEEARWVYCPVVKFEYQRGASIYQSLRYGVAMPDFSCPTWAEACSLLSNAKAGSNIQVHVCPADPRWAVVRADASRRRRSHIYVVLLAGAAVTSLALLLPILAVA